MDWTLRADAFALPFRPATFDVVVADPPYDCVRPAGKRIRGKTLRETGYIVYQSRDWWAEARRVLRPDGHLYVFALIKEIGDWWAVAAPDDVIAWIYPNGAGTGSMIRRRIGGRALAWRPIFHYGPRMRWRSGDFVEPNYVIAPQVQSNMAEAEPWPNQLPVRMLTWLLQPHRGARVLDLFAGTGSTREAAIGLGLDVVSVDLSPQAVALTVGRASQIGML